VSARFASIDGALELEVEMIPIVSGFRPRCVSILAALLVLDNDPLEGLDFRSGRGSIEFSLTYSCTRSARVEYA